MVLSKKALAALAFVVASTTGSAFAATTNPVAQWDWRLTSGFTSWRDTLFGSAPVTGLQDNRLTSVDLNQGFALRGSDGSSMTGYRTIDFGGGTYSAQVGGAGYNAATCRLRAGSSIDAICKGGDISSSTLAINSPTQSPPEITVAANAANYGAFSEIGRFTFADGNIAASSAFLDRATYTTNLNLKAVGDTRTYDELQTLARSIEIDFFETNNAGDLFSDGVRCASGLGNVAGNSGSSGCKDIFVVKNFLTEGLLTKVLQDGIEYVFSTDFFVLENDGNGGVREVKAGLLSEEACRQAGQFTTDGSGNQQVAQCYGFVTAEGQISNVSMRTQVRVSAFADIPEPSTYALLGLGLAGLAFARRRKA
jgi:PEP-CTERM motif